jgi:hypothetical protein
MKRAIRITVEVGDASKDECGECPFRQNGNQFDHPISDWCEAELDEDNSVPDGKRLLACKLAEIAIKNI